MKRSKLKEKSIGPMFPRLHVSDIDKGPRAPPRNKMALYEQLCNPTQQLSSGVSPLGTGCDKTLVNLSSSAHTDQAKRFHSHSYELNSNLSLQQKQGKKAEEEEEDFRPILVEPRIGYHGLQVSKKTISMEKLRRCDDDETHTTLINNLRPDLTSKNKPRSNDDNQSILQMAKPGTEIYRKISDGEVSIRRSRSDISECVNVVPEPAMDSSGDNRGNSSDNENVSGRCLEWTCSSLSIGNVDKSDNVSESSMVDSIPHLNVTPDDVVGRIGRKQFWRARKAIASIQQRMFASQLFDLHRLIKVQQLIAISPKLLLEECTLLGTPARKIPSQYVRKPLECTRNCKNNSEKLNENLECSAENAVRKAPFCAKVGSQPPKRGPDSGCLRPMAMAIDTSKMASLAAHHPTQWLFPVMSPSEGLIYKPCPGPVFFGTVPGGSRPYSAIPWPYYQGIEVLPAALMTNDHSTLASSTHEQNLNIRPASNRQNSQFSEGAATDNINRRNSHKPKIKRIESESVAVNSRAGNSVAEQRDEHSNFSVPTEERDSQPLRPIRVVPHNGRSVSESVARIFRSIQKERAE